MTDLFEFNLISDRTSSKSRRSYSQRNVSSLQLELTKNRKMINVKTSKTTILNRTLSFKPITSPPLADVENTPIKKISYEFNATQLTSVSQDTIDDTPVKEEDNIENDTLLPDKMTRDIQRLSHRLRSSIPLYNISILDNQSTKPATLHLSQVVNRVSRCNYVLRRFVREAQKYSPKSNEIQLVSKPVLSLQSHEKGRRRLFIDSPKQDTINSTSEKQPPVTPGKTSGVMKQLFTSPLSTLKRTLPAANISLTIDDKRQKLF